jgi:protein SCO1/2
VDHSIEDDVLIAMFFAAEWLVAAPPSRLAVIRPAPEFTLTDTAGKKVALRDQGGKVVVLGFIFTTCSGSCPATTHRMAKIQTEVQRRPELKGRVQFLSITLDPAKDDAAALRRYMELYEIDSGNWSFLTGSGPEIAKVLAEFDMWARPAANGQLDHPSRIFLIDQKSRLREIYNLDFLRTSWIVEDMLLLLGER